MSLLPDGIAMWEALALTAFSACTSLLTAAVGIGGGVLLLAAMTFVVPVAALVPVHGVVQLGSNAGRSVILARAVALRLIVPFALAAIAGAAVGGVVVTELPDAAILAAIGVFVLVSAWTKVPPLGRGQTGVLAVGGFLATILTMFVGATGPFVIALLRQAGLAHRSLVATTGAAMTIQHTLKVVAFAAIGFAFAEWVWLAAAMIAAGFFGTLAGTRLLAKLPEESLRTALKIVLTLVGLQLLVRTALSFA